MRHHRTGTQASLVFRLLTERLCGDRESNRCFERGEVQQEAKSDYCQMDDCVVAIHDPGLDHS